MSLHNVDLLVIKRLLASLVCLCLGTTIYCLFRNDVVFLRFLNHNTPVFELRQHLYIEKFIIYNLPDMLWALSLMFYLSIINNRTIRIIGLLTPIILECAQISDIIPGTFDIIDLTIYFLIIFVSFIIWKQRKEL